MVAQVVGSLSIPPEARVDRRVPKTLLVEHGAPTAADRRQVQECIEEIRWLAALKPSNIGVPAFSDDLREYLEVAVVTMRLRRPSKGKPRVPRMIELVHRAIPYPLLLVTALPGEEGAEPSVVVSLAHLRRSLNETGAFVVEAVEESPSLDGDGTNASAALFLQSLSVASLPRENLYRLYDGWIERLIALRTASVTGAFTIPRTPTEAAARREALAQYQRLTSEASRLRTEAKRERQTRRLVELNLELQRLERERAEAKQVLQAG